MAALAMPRLGAANAVRTARKDLLDQLRRAPSKLEAQERCAEMLMSCDPALDGVGVFDLVRQCHGVGRDRARSLLREAGINDLSVPVGEMYARDALRLQAVLRGER